MPVKHVPVRTCCGCGRKSGKRDMVRIVRSPGGVVSVDTTGKAAGRGAYLCENPACWETGVNRNRLERTLKTMIGSDQRIALLAFAEEQQPEWVA
ncbi:MAG: YlxR family protein [SAR202 cluster bacterium]|nr:YlxR family protein [SAR202 cluster bacterium]